MITAQQADNVPMRAGSLVGPWRRASVWAIAAVLAIVVSSVPVAPADASAPPSGPDAASVERLYRAYFLRDPDPGGVAYWNSRRDAGMSITAISQAFAASSEFRARYGAVDDAEFVRLVYANVLDRAPDPAGLAHWTRQLSAGRSRGLVMIGFSDSAEFKVRTGYFDSPTDGRGIVPDAEDWLGWLNQVRAEAGLGRVQSVPAWCDGARAHGVYAVRNQRFEHDEDTGLPHHTAGGRHATRTGNLFASSTRMTPAAAIDGWMESPGHALWMLHPGLTRAGYGEFFDPGQVARSGSWPMRWVAVLPLVDGVDHHRPPVPFTYPGPGSTTLRRPGVLYASFSSAVTCPCTVSVEIDGRAVRAAVGQHAYHRNALHVDLAERIAPGSRVQAQVRSADGRTAQWSFSVAAHAVG